MTTLVRPGDDESLWRFLWLNTPKPDSDKAPPIETMAKVFPWLAPTITSEGNRKVTPASSHPLQAFWGMPRRIRLVFAPNETRAPCPITGEIDETIVTGFRMLPNGVSYEGFEHPLTPHYRAKKDAPLLPIHPQPGGVPYRDWPSLVGEGSKDGDLRRPASIVPVAMDRLRIVFSARQRRARLLACGYDMDNMKARGFVETAMPIFGIGLGPNRRSEIEGIARDLAGAADLAANAVARAVRDALAGDRADIKATPFSSVRESFFESTEHQFFDMLGYIEAPMLASDAARAAIPGETWRRVLRSEGLRLFEDHVQPEDRPEHEMERALLARKSLFWFFAGAGKQGFELYSKLSLPPPEKAAKRKGRVLA